MIKIELRAPGGWRCAVLAFFLLKYAGIATACGGATANDWISQADPLYVRAAPADCATVLQSPPEFAWPPYPGAIGYEFALDFADGHSQSVVSGANWIAWQAVLPAADYAWRVRPVTGSAPVPFSQPRGFTVPDYALPFVPPAPSDLAARALNTARPRSLPVGHENLTWRANLMTMRYPAVQSLRARVAGYSGLPVSVPASDPSNPTPMVLQVQIAAQTETARLLDTALAWVLAGQLSDRDEAKRRCLAIAGWDSAGLTSYASNDTVSMNIAWTLTLAYDWLYPNLADGERQIVLAAISARTGPAFDSLAGPLGSYAKVPYDSHGAYIMAEISAVSVLLAGDLPDATTWLQGAVPLYAHYLSRWGPDDGGHANGTSYAMWDTDGMLFMWDILKRGTLLDLTAKAWVRNFDRQYAYFLPPGAPAGLFGDGAEVKRDEEWGRYSKAFGARVPSALMRWYVGQVTGGEPSLAMALLSAPAPVAATLPAGTPPATLLASTGWAAMHASLDNPPPFSVYFKSSPYGSYNHGHADQNSFVIHAGGEALAIASGVYDWYASPHWLGWYAQTRAHNAITYDGGQGQLLGPRGDGLLSASGSITAFATSAQSDIVVGDATPAYGPGFGRVVRALAYLRPHTVVVFDDLASANPHQWEWNLHAPAPFAPAGGGVLAIAGSANNLCVRVFAMDGTTYSTSSGFSAPPATPPAGQQWHAVFQTPAVQSARFISVLDPDCAGLGAITAPTLDGAVMSIKVGSQLVSFDTGSNQLGVTAAP